MALIGSLTRDIILCIVPHLRALDLLNLSSKNHQIYENVFCNEDVWRCYVITNSADSSWKGISKNEISWKELAQIAHMQAHHGRTVPNQISMELQKVHLRKRLNAPQSSRDYLRIFIEITSDDPRVQKVIIPGVEMSYQDSLEFAHVCAMSFAFTPLANGKPTTCLEWYGEGGIHSSVNIYFIDRRSTPIRVECRDIPGLIMSEPANYANYKTTLGKKDYAHIGQILHKDPKYYEGVSSTKYNYSTGHGYFRSGNAPIGMASSTSSIDKPDLFVHCHTKFVRTISVKALYERFIVESEPEPNPHNANNSWASVVDNTL